MPGDGPHAQTMNLPSDSIIKAKDCLLGAEVGRGAFGAVRLAMLKGSVQACAKVRAHCACSTRAFLLLRVSDMIVLYLCHMFLRKLCWR